MKHTKPRSVNPSVFLLFFAALALSSCGKEENNTPTPSEDMSAMVDMGEGEDMPRTCEGAGCEEMDVPSTCGDGNLDEGEACDDGNKDDGDYCAADCSRETGACGDGIQQDNEACDDGMNPDGACSYGETSCMACDASCQLTDGATSFCGDGVVQQEHGELCDDGDDNADDAECLPDCTRPLPVKVIGAEGSSYVLMSNGTVYSWGANHAGQLGNGTLEHLAQPTQVQNLTNVVDLISRSGVVCAFRLNGELFCWGANAVGASGNGTFEQVTSPTKVLGLPNIITAAAGKGFVCAVAQGGDVYCWGLNGDRQLGFIGENQNLPVKVELPHPAVDVELGEQHACAILETSDVWCWGSGVGYGYPGFEGRLPQEVAELRGATELFSGRGRIFFLRAGELWGIGSNEGSRLHVCCEDQYNEAVRIEALSNVASVDSERDHSCVLREDQSAYCWGSNIHGQLSKPDTVEAEIIDIGLVLDIDVGRIHTCAINSENRVFCWGNNEFGQLGFDGEGGPTPREVTFWP